MSLSPAQIQIRDVARSFARERLAPRAAERDRTCAFPAEEMAELGRLGFLGMLVPESSGGSGLDVTSLVLAIEEIAAAEGGTSTIVHVHNFSTAMLERSATDEQRERWVRPAARGEILPCFCLTEPGAGSDAAAIRTRARRDGDAYVIDGVKQFITTGSRAQVAIVVAVTDPAAGTRGISAFVVPTDTPGFRVSRVERKLGQHVSDTAEIALEECRVPAAFRLGEEGAGFKLVMADLEAGRVSIAAQAVGMARAAYELALAYAKQRRAFGKPIFEHQAVAFRLADMATQIEAARALVLHAAALRDAGAPCGKETSMAKLFASEMAERVCSDAIQIHGGNGYVEDYGVERIWRDVRVTKIYEGTSDIQRLIIGRAIAAE